MRTIPSSRSAFTLAEILIALMVMTMGLLSVIALTLAGTRDANNAIGMSTAYATARTALYDPSQLDTTKTLDDASVTGFLNGYYVVRTIESSRAMPGSGGDVDYVKVRVFWGDGGAELAGISTYLHR